MTEQEYLYAQALTRVRDARAALSECNITDKRIQQELDAVVIQLHVLETKLFKEVQDIRDATDAPSDD